MEEMIKKYYDFDTTFGKCSQCSGFEGTWSCPGFDFDPLGYWKQFSALRLIVDRISNEGCATVEEAQQRLFDEKKNMTPEMLALEATWPGSMSLAQECNLVKVRPSCRQALRSSDSMRYALESPGHAGCEDGAGLLRLRHPLVRRQVHPQYYLLVADC